MKAFLVLAALLAAPPMAKRAQLPRGSGAQVTDADVGQLLAEWAVFDAAIAGLHDSVPSLPGGGASPGDLEEAEHAWGADTRVRAALEKAGTTPEAFLGAYRRIAEAWWTLAEAEAREATAQGLRREIEALRASDSDGNEVADELQKGLDRLEKERAAVQRRDLAVVRRHREELERVFSPEAPRP